LIDRLQLRRLTSDREVVGSTSRSCRYQVLSDSMGDCLHRYIHHQGNSAFHPSGVGKSSTGLYGWGWGVARSPVSGGTCRQRCV